MAIVPCLHQGNIYTKRKLRVWRDQKCIQLVGAITALTCAAVKIPRFEGGSIGPRTESWVNWDGAMAMVPCLHQGNIYTKRKLRVWRDQKCYSASRCNNSTYLCGRQNTPSRGRQYRAQNGKLGKLGRSYGHGTVFAPRKYLHQKEATCMERPEMYSVIRCNNPTLPVRVVKIPRLEGGSIGPKTGSCVN